MEKNKPKKRGPGRPRKGEEPPRPTGKNIDRIQVRDVRRDLYDTLCEEVELRLTERAAKLQQKGEEYSPSMRIRAVKHIITALMEIGIRACETDTGMQTLSHIGSILVDPTSTDTQTEKVRDHLYRALLEILLEEYKQRTSGDR